MDNRNTLLPLILVATGVVFLLMNLDITPVPSGMFWQLFWPTALLMLGVVLLVGNRRGGFRRIECWSIHQPDGFVLQTIIGFITALVMLFIVGPIILGLVAPILLFVFVVVVGAILFSIGAGALGILAPLAVFLAPIILVVLIIIRLLS